ncbi:MAG: phosphate/phosphite/phosphonate ABC transporter substrate-binding protein [Nitrososphaerales archaeon]
MVSRYVYAVIPAVLVIGIVIGYALTLPSSAVVARTDTLQKQVSIAIQPTASAQDIESQAKDLEKFLEQKTGYDIQIYVPTTYAGAVEALRFNKVDLAFMSAWPSYLASKKAGADLGLAEVREVIIDEQMRAETYYYSYWVVKKDSPYQSLEQLKGKRAAFPSALSTSGYVAPMGRMVELGYLTTEQGKEVDPKQFFSEVFFAGGYAQAWEALKNDKVDVTIIAGDVSEKLYREVLDNTRVLEQQGPIPSHGVVFNKDMDPKVKEDMKKALLELGKDDSTRSIMRKLISAIFVGFKETNSETHLGMLSKALEVTGLKFTETLK